MLSALKQAEDRSSTIVRLFNPGDETASVVLRLDAPIAQAFAVNFLEERQEALAPRTAGFTLRTQAEADSDDRDRFVAAVA